MLDRTGAIAAVQAEVPIDSIPAVTPDELGRIVDNCLICSVRADSAAYTVGTRVYVPDIGRYLKCSIRGTTDSAEPDWPNQNRQGYHYQDGSVVWEDDGPAYTEIYDIGKACRDLCQLKANKSAHLVNFKDRTMEINQTSIYKHWMQLAAQYVPIEVG